MSMIGSRYLASAAIAALLAMPVGAVAQSAAPSATTTSPMPAQTTTAQSAEQRVETHIQQLHAQLRITAAEQPQWNQFAAVMRENARGMDQAFMQRAQQYPTMSAVQNMQSYEQIAATHAADMQKLVPAFESLYNVMPEQQKRLADQVFRANAEAHTQQRMQTGRNG
jgi:periplasmic protein CpxP/Spy